MTRRYGELPIDLGLIDICHPEMLFWMYCPVSLPGMKSYILPANLKPFAEIASAAKAWDPSRFEESYVYLTAKTLWVSGDYIGNRPGWHSDGFGTDDVNYIWADRAPTDFLWLTPGVELSEDCDLSMAQMAYLAERNRQNIVKFPDRHLLRLNPSVIHRSPVKFSAGMRTFVKVSISRHRYDLVGNSLNHDLPESYWPLVQRQNSRNHPSSESA